MKLSATEGTAILLLAGVVAYSAGSVAGRRDGTTIGLAGDWQAAFTLDRAFPPHADAVGRTVAARVHIDPGAPGPSRSAVDGRPRALDGDLRAFGVPREGVRRARVHAARGDSVEVAFGRGGGALVLVGRLECGRVTGRWRHGSRAETETGRFELRRAPDARGIHPAGDGE